MRLLFTKFDQLFIFCMILLSGFNALIAIKYHRVSFDGRGGKLRAFLGEEIIWVFISHALRICLFLVSVLGVLWL